MRQTGAEERKCTVMMSWAKTHVLLFSQIPAGDKVGFRGMSFNDMNMFQWMFLNRFLFFSCLTVEFLNQGNRLNKFKNQHIKDHFFTS